MLERASLRLSNAFLGEVTLQVDITWPCSWHREGFLHRWYGVSAEAHLACRLLFGSLFPHLNFPVRL